MRHTLCALAFLLLAGPAFADTLTLENGGKVEGPIETVVFRQQDKKTSYERAEVASITLKGGKALDTIMLANGIDQSGELVSLTVRTIAGVLSFGRDRLVKIEIQERPLYKRVAEFKRRRAAIQDNDAAGLCKLAVWCQDNALVAEARATAQECLELKPDDATAATAHVILGHVLKDGKWLESARSAVQPAATAKSVDPALGALMTKIIAEYGVWATEAKQSDQDKWKTTYEPKWTKAREKVAKAKGELDKSEAEKTRLRDEIRAEKKRCRDNGNCPTIQKHVDELEKQLARERSSHSRLERAYTQAKATRFALVSRMKRDRSRIRSREETRVRQILLARSKITRLLQMGRQLTDAEMREICKDIVGR